MCVSDGVGVVWKEQHYLAIRSRTKRHIATRRRAVSARSPSKDSKELWAAKINIGRDSDHEAYADATAAPAVAGGPWCLVQFRGEQRRLFEYE